MKHLKRLAKLPKTPPKVTETEIPKECAGVDGKSNPLIEESLGKNANSVCNAAHIPKEKGKR